MSLRSVEDAAEAAIALAVPQTRLAKPIAWAGAALLAIALLGLTWWLLFGRSHGAQVKAATSHVEAATAAATAGAAQDAVKIITVHDREVERVRTITEGGVDAVHHAPGADAPVPDVARAMRVSLCLFGAYRADPDCAALPGDRARVGAADPDAGSAAAGG